MVKLISIILGFSMLMANTSESKAKDNLILMELYTSQGCSSCPAADKVLANIAKTDKRVLPLAFHVDYWNYLGWKDTFSKAKFTTRQRNYSYILNQRGRIYTPQAIIAGKVDIVGSDKDRLREAIDYAALLEQYPLQIATTQDNDKLSIAIGASALGPQASKILLLGVYNKKPVKITRGENAGDTITYHHIVNDIVELPAYKGTPYTATMQLPGGDFWVILVQDLQGKVLGLKKIS